MIGRSGRGEYTLAIRMMKAGAFFLGGMKPASLCLAALARNGYRTFESAVRYSLAPFYLHRKLSGVGQDGRQIKLQVGGRQSGTGPDVSLDRSRFGSPTAPGNCSLQYKSPSCAFAPKP